MRICPKCHEAIEDAFAVCWNCGTALDGTEDPDFEAVKRGGDTAGADNRLNQNAAMIKACIKPFGWLLLGFCWGLVIAHAMAVSVISRGYYWEEILGAMLVILPAAGLVGIPFGLMLERSKIETGKPKLGRCWLVLCAVAFGPLIFELPAMNCARE